MPLSRALRPFRNYLHPRSNSPFTNLFERDPFLAPFAPLFDVGLVNPQRYNIPRVQLKRSPTAYRLEAEVPGFRKDDLSIEFVDSRTLRIEGKRKVAGKAEDAVESTNDADIVDSEQPKSPETTEQVESKGLTPAQAEEEFQLVESDGVQETSFTGQWTLPEDIDRAAVTASLDHGILSLVLPKMKPESAHKITIE